MNFKIVLVLFIVYELIRTWYIEGQFNFFISLILGVTKVIDDIKKDIDDIKKELDDIKLREVH